MAREQHALGWADPCSPTPEWDEAQVKRLARRLGYPLRWADPRSPLGLVDQLAASGAEVLLLPSTAHVDVVTLDRLMSHADVECAAPRASFARWSVGGVQR
ncbi:hypothetical protein ACTD5D_33265 [Nocardia takedensis]|uniref:hypothetical protein n=1 Tax=Nocardia takedensis TaxID=259390 RepID=UPI003F769ACD